MPPVTVVAIYKIKQITIALHIVHSGTNQETYCYEPNFPPTLVFTNFPSLKNLETASSRINAMGQNMLQLSSN